MILICLHHAGGSPLVFNSWRQSTSPFLLNTPSLMPEHLIDYPEYSIENMATKIIESDLPEKVNQPFGIYGHSMGATVAFELAWKLQVIANCTARFIVMAAPSHPSSPRLQLPKNSIPSVQQRIELGCAAIDSYTPKSKHIKSPIYTMHGSHDQIVTETSSLAWKNHTRSTYQHLSLKGEGHLFHIESPGIILAQLMRIKSSVTNNHHVPTDAI